MAKKKKEESKLDYRNVVPSMTPSMIYGYEVDSKTGKKISRLCRVCHQRPAMTEVDYSTKDRIVKTSKENGTTFWRPQHVAEHRLCYKCRKHQLELIESNDPKKWLLEKNKEKSSPQSLQTQKDRSRI